MSPACSEPPGSFRGTGRCLQSFPFPLDPQHPHGYLTSPLPPRATPWPKAAPSQHRVAPTHTPAPSAPPDSILRAEESREQSVSAVLHSCRPPPEQHPGEQGGAGQSTATPDPTECPESIHPLLSGHVQPLAAPCPAAGSCVRPLRPLRPHADPMVAGAGEPRSLPLCRRGARRGLTIPTLSGCRCVGKSGASGRHRY